MFAHSLNVKQFYLSHRWDPIRCYHSKSECTWEQWQWRSTPYFPKLQNSIIGRILLIYRDAVGVFYSPSQLCWEDQGIHSFLKGISPKVNVMTVVTVQHISHFSMETSPTVICVQVFLPNTNDLFSCMVSSIPI